MPNKVCALCKTSPKEESSLKVCSGCGEVAYCSKECQREHWKEHKKSCKQKHKQAAAAAPAPGQRIRDDDAEEVQVLWEDQQRINDFGRLNNRNVEIRDLLAVKQKDLENLKDATTDLEMILDDDCCKIKVGEVFMECSNEEAEEYVEAKKEEMEGEVKELLEERASLAADMEKLKALLYAKFGKQINLEVDPESNEE